MDSKKGMKPMAHLLDLTEQDLDSIPPFQPDDWPDITRAYSFYVRSWFCKPLKLIQGGEIIGIGNIIYMHDTAWLSQIIVRPANRNQGWGKFITQGLIDQCKPMVRTISLLATDLGFPVYQKLGFKTQSIYHFYKGDPLPSIPGIDAVQQYDTQCHCDILELDKSASGEIRSRLLQDHMQNAKVILTQKEVIAFYLPTLGEGLIMSKQVEAGLQLLAYHLRDKGKIVIPEENNDATEFLLSRGYMNYRKAHRMYSGDAIPYKPQWIFSRVGGNLG